jgi:tRNA nucleotidyltransferase (CCA-adding enzyme)
MQTYLVGGAVRDKLLNIPVKDRDWVVVGATIEEMLNNDFQQVGKDFPVFLHPHSKEEYALARTERKSGKGYTGFIVHASPEVTLEEDLLRRDLTINAMAEDESGNLIDPYQGLQDIKEKILRHVSPAFAEDPLRVLRVARFAARFAQLGFSIAPETLNLMKNIVENGELQYLIAERVWQEIQNALSENSPQVFFEVLRSCNALVEIMPELNALFGVPQPAKYHPEIDTGIHTLMVLKQACILSKNPAVRFAALCHDLGKAITDPEKWPSHKNHESLGATAIRELCSRIKVPNEFRELALIVCLHHTACHRANEHSAEQLLKTLQNTDALRRQERFELFLLACEADAKGRLGYEQSAYPQAELLRKVLSVANTVETKDILDAGFSGKDIGQQLEICRIKEIDKALN